jgi:DNA-binding CsgD family transcriptional regulator
MRARHEGVFDPRIQRFWDDLAEFEVARTDAAVRYTIATLSGLIEAKRGFWLGSVRLGDRVPGDPLAGWRPGAISETHPPDPREGDRFREQCQRIEKGQIDPSIVENVRDAGRFRVNIKHELVPPEWFESEFYRRFFEDDGVQDMIYVVTPLGTDVESWFGFQRIDHAEPHFGETERATLATAMRPLRWFNERIALQYGLRVASTPLTPAERRVLNALLNDRTEQAVADELGLSQATVHTYCSRIARKFNVRGRAGLMALWLG